MQISPAIPSAFSTIWRASRSELSSSALAAACANGPPEPIAIRPCSGSSTSPLPEISSDASLSATASMASSRPSRRSVRHSLASSTGASELAIVGGQLVLEQFEQREGVGGGAGKARQHVGILAEPADLAGIGLDHGVAQRDLAVAAKI